jgi:hypothetical protein
LLLRLEAHPQEIPPAGLEPRLCEAAVDQFP